MDSQYLHSKETDELEGNGGVDHARLRGLHYLAHSLGLHSEKTFDVQGSLRYNCIVIGSAMEILFEKYILSEVN